MAPKFIPFEDVEACADILQLAQMLNLEIRRSGNQFRGTCPVHGGDHRTLCISPQVRSRRGSDGVFYCQQAKEGGDRIGLVAHVMEMGQQDAAFFIAQQFGMEIANSGTSSTVTTSKPTSPPAREKAETKRETTRSEFDPAAFAQKLEYTEEIAALGISEDDAKALGIGAYRGKIYQALRYDNGQVAGFSWLLNGELHLPKTLLPQSGNIVPFKARA